MNTQESLFGKTSQEHSLPTEVLISGSSSMKWQKQGRWSSNGPSWMLNFSECPSEDAAFFSQLSSILEMPSDVDSKFFLSPKACQGILRRAQRRGKELPPVLLEALQRVASRAPLETPEWKNGETQS
jgi:hypothetical protein